MARPPNWFGSTRTKAPVCTKVCIARDPTSCPPGPTAKTRACLNLRLGRVPYCVSNSAKGCLTEGRRRYFTLREDLYHKMRVKRVASEIWQAYHPVPLLQRNKTNTARQIASGVARKTRRGGVLTDAHY